MQINFTGKNIEITPALKTFATEKLQHIEKRYNRITQLNVVLHLENVTHIAEATLHMNGAEIHATGKSDDMYKAIEVLTDKLVDQVTKHKEKMIDSHR